MKEGNINKQNIYNRNWMNKQKKKGLCIFCKAKRLENSNLCENHFFKSIAMSVLKNKDLAEDLRHLFYLQEEKCYISGIKLTLGLNAGLDHILPISKRPDLTSELGNVRWVDKTINRVKRDLPLTDFINLCEKVAQRKNQIRAML